MWIYLCFSNTYLEFLSKFISWLESQSVFTVTFLSCFILAQPTSTTPKIGSYLSSTYGRTDTINFSIIKICLISTTSHNVGARGTRDEPPLISLTSANTISRSEDSMYIYVLLYHQVSVYCPLPCTYDKNQRGLEKTILNPSSCQKVNQYMQWK